MTEKIKPENQNLETMAVKANLNKLEREYFDKLKAELLQILNGKTLEDIERTQDLVLARKASKKMAEILEFLKSKDIKDEEMKEKSYEELLEWARDDLRKENAEEWLEQIFDLDSLPRVKVKGGELNLSKTKVSYLPKNLEVESLIMVYTRNLITLPYGMKLKELYAAYSEISTLAGVEVTKVLGIVGNKIIRRLPSGMKLEELYAAESELSTLEGVEVTKILQIRDNQNIKRLPSEMKLDYLYALESGLEDLPDDLIVSERLNVRGCSERVKQKARELTERGQIGKLGL
ncbi:hypothetical protein KKC32_04890 [Patescibacteria group bacterium]|nr:hypothetical protein [Patescibacteria group bacterium]